MAQHHFYSRVPAYMSLFNRMDSYDTFAYSDGLEIDFIEKELSAIYDNKPSKGDATKIRKGELKPIYLQYFTKSGTLAQGCISFLPLDYTGERSSYFVHTIVPDESEAEALMCSPDNSVFNPDMFMTNPDEFDLSSPDSHPNEHYPETEYEPIKASGTEMFEKYDSAMMKRLIFAMLNIACGKGKPVFISLPFSQQDISREGLNFITSLIGIFPYCIRRAFTFVTYTDEAARFPGFNIRFLSDHTVEIPAAKGITLHFAYKLTIGLSDETVASAGALVEFFYGLLENDAVRREFIYFMDKAVETVPDLRKLNLKTLGELVFVFQQCSGLFNEKSVLPNDEKMYEYICAYEKHRKALSPEYRAGAMKCLKRYPANHTAIPKDVFSKVQKIYPTEPSASKRVIMDVVLDLIHTDVMREKLFPFIKSNYSGEDRQMKDIIVNDLCRVYYGGFLQPQIIAFFDQEFGGMSEKARDAVVEKLLLTIRTEAVTGKIVEFFDNHYDEITPKQKAKLYSTACDMLAPSDAISVEIIKLINRHIESESGDIRSAIASRVYSMAEANQRSKQPKLLGCLLSAPGFCADVAIRGVFEHSGNKIFAHFILMLHNLPVERKIGLYDEIWKIYPDMPIETAQRWADMMCQCYEVDPGEKMNIYALTELDASVSAHLKGTDAEKAFAEKTLTDLIRPALLKSLPQAFSVKQRRDGLEFIINYAKNRAYIRNSAGYADIQKYANITDALAHRDYNGMIVSAVSLTEGSVRQNAAEHLSMTYLTTDVLAGEENIPSKVITELLVGYLKTGELDFSAPYSEVNSFYRTAAEGTADAETTSAQKAIKCILGAAHIMYSSALPEETRKHIVMAGSSLGGVIAGFVSGQKHGAKFVTGYVDTPKFEKTFFAGVNQLVKAADVSGGGFFSRLFGRK